MNDDYKLKARYTKILTAKDLADRFSSDTQFKSKYKALSTSTLYNLLETLVSNNYISYNYLDQVLPNHYPIKDSSKTEFILSDYPFASSLTYFDSYGRYVTLESTSSPVNLTMKKTSSDTNVLDLEYPSNKTFILYTFGTKRYNANRDTEGTIFYYFTDEHNPIVDGKCIIISNNKSSGLSKAVGALPSSEDRTDSFLDPHANNLVYKSDNLVSDTGWITSTVLDPNNVCTYNNGQVATGLQIRKVGKTVYLNLTLSLTLDEGAATSDQYLLILDEKYRPTQAIYFTLLLTYNGELSYDSAQSCVITILPNGRVEILNYKEVARKQTELGSGTLGLRQLVSYPV